ncbi:MAG: crotonase/enoyl-CoA hydratase family protein [Sphingomonadaceae bacterium]
MKDRVSITMLGGGIADVKLIRADKMNALDPAMFAGIAEAIATLNATPGLRVVVVSGEGKSFCAGLDMASMAGGGSGNDLAARNFGDANLAQQVAWGWRTLAVPVIMAVHGVAFGGGFQIMSGGDIRIAHPASRMAIMELKWGLVPDMAGFPLWRGLVRDDILRELTYTNREFSGTEAHGFGFVTHLADDPHAAALELAQIIAAKNPHAIRGAKRLCNAMGDLTDAELLVLETEEQLKVIRKPNQIEAVMANMEKRAPVFAD